MNEDAPQHVIGWKEYVDFVDWKIRRVKAKIDTGARTSAIDVDSYHLSEANGEGLVVEMRLRLHRRRPHREVVVRAPVVKMIVVCNSNGLREQRPLIETRIRLGPVVKTVRLTVTNRANMRFAMILGRKAIEGDFAVDVSRKYVQRTKGIEKRA
jgi:hypothetical protein